MPRTISFEGRSVVVPDDATDDEVSQILGAAPPSTPMNNPAVADSAAMREPVTNDVSMSSYLGGKAAYLGGVVDQGARGIAKGLIAAGPALPNTLSQIGQNVQGWGLKKLGVPDDAADMIANILTPIDNVTPSYAGMTGAVDSANDMTADAIGAERPRREPDNFPELAAGTIGEYVGGAMLPVGGAIARAEQLGMAGVRKMPEGIIKNYVERAAVNPGEMVRKETMMAAGAGMGAAGAREVMPDNPYAEFGAALLGGSGVGIARGIGSSAKTIFDAIFRNGSFSDDVVKTSAARQLGEAAGLPGAGEVGAVIDTDPLVDIINNPVGPRPGEVISGFKESLADRTRNPGLAAEEYNRAQTGLFAQRRADNATAAEAALGALEPKATPGAYRDAAAAEREHQFQLAQRGTTDADAAMMEAIGPLTPTMTGGQRGGTIRNVLEENHDVARERVHAAYGAVEVAGKSVDPTDLAQSLDEGIAGLTEVEKGLVPQSMIDRVARLGRPSGERPQPTGILDASGKPLMRDPEGPANMDLKQATMLRSELQRERSNALGDAKLERGGRNAARVIGQMLERVDDYIAANLSPEEQAGLAAAKGAKFDEAEAFTRRGDPIAEVLARHEGGVPKVRDDMVAGKFVNPQAMDTLFAEADTPEVRSAIREELLTKGNFDKPERIAQFQARYGEQIAKFPGLADELGLASQARGRVAEAGAAHSKLEADLGSADGTKPGRSTVGKYLQFSDANADRAMSEVMAAKDPAKAADELMTFVKDAPEAVEGAKAAWWKVLRKKSQSVDNSQRSMDGGKAWNGQWLKRELGANKAVVERIYRDNPEQLENINKIADVLDSTDLRQRGKTPGTSGTAQGIMAVLPSMASNQSKMFAVARGQISPGYVVTSTLALIAKKAVGVARQNAVNKLVDNALLDPDLAATLLKDYNPVNRAALLRPTSGWKHQSTIHLLNGILTEDDDETNEAIMRDKK